jgi:hypothetical protein
MTERLQGRFRLAGDSLNRSFATSQSHAARKIDHKILKIPVAAAILMVRRLL